MTNKTSQFTSLITSENIAALKYEVETFKRDHRGEVRTTALWDAVVAECGDGKGEYKRSEIVRDVLEAAGLWSDEPQKKDGKRTAWGTVVQKMGARFDLAVKRAKPEMNETDKDYLAAVLKSIDTATSHGIDAERVLEAATEYVQSLLG